MKSILFAILMLGFVNASANTPVVGEGTVLATNTATLWNIDASHSAVSFRIRHFFTPVPGVFERWSGTLHFDANNLAGSQIDINIDVASVNTKNVRRDEHLRNPDFFEVEKFPSMTFKSSQIRSTGVNTFVATGELTIKETTQTIELPFEFLGAMAHPWRENTEVAGFKADYSLMRLQFGVGTGDFVQTTVVGDQVDIEIFLEVTRSL